MANVLGARAPEPARRLAWLPTGLVDDLAHRAAWLTVFAREITCHRRGHERRPDFSRRASGIDCCVVNPRFQPAARIGARDPRPLQRQQTYRRQQTYWRRQTRMCTGHDQLNRLPIAHPLWAISDVVGAVQAQFEGER